MTEIKRKKVLYRAVNRGCKETDILIGKFAEENIKNLSEAELQVMEELLDESDNDIYNWLTDQAEMPEKYAKSVGQKIRKFWNV